jgi:hypothetical protein
MRRNRYDNQYDPCLAHGDLRRAGRLQVHCAHQQKPRAQPVLPQNPHSLRRADARLRAAARTARGQSLVRHALQLHARARAVHAQLGHRLPGARHSAGAHLSVPPPAQKEMDARAPRAHGRADRLPRAAPSERRHPAARPPVRLVRNRLGQPERRRRGRRRRQPRRIPRRIPQPIPRPIPRQIPRPIPRTIPPPPPKPPHRTPAPHRAPPAS